MTWNNRIFMHRHAHTDSKGRRCWSISFAIHETHYDKNGKINGWTKEAMSGHYETVADLIKSHEIMLKDAKRFENKVLKYK